MLVTLRSAFRPLRSQHVFPTLCASIRALNERRQESFRVVEFSVQVDHMHLLVEAADARALSAGLRGLAVSIARQVNSLVRRHGRLWADRWHGRALHTPRAVRHALVYVLANAQKHGTSAPVRTAARSVARALDQYSSAAYFGGFREYAAAPAALGFLSRAHAPPDGQPTAAARSWLLRTGWRRCGRISVFEAPRVAPSSPSAGAARGRAATR